jgi:transportin-1
LIPILLNPKSPKSLSENAAVTIGRLGLVCPSMIAPELGTFAQAWCSALWEIKDNEEKDSAFRGFCMMISENPAGLENVSGSGAFEKSVDAEPTIELYLVL